MTSQFSYLPWACNRDQQLMNENLKGKKYFSFFFFLPKSETTTKRPQQWLLETMRTGLASTLLLHRKIKNKAP